MKTFLKSIGGLFAIIILAAVVIAFISWSRVPDILATNLSKKMKVTVDIDEINLGFSNINVEKIKIGNPPNSILPKAFSADLVSVNSPLTRYLDKNIVIEEINISDIYLGLEFNTPRGTQGNWTTIMGNVSSSTSSSSKKINKTLLIKRLVLTNIATEVAYKESGHVKKLPIIDRIELTNISSEGGFPMDQLMSSVLGQMLKQVFIKQNLQNMLEGILQNPQELIENPRGAIQKAIEPFTKGLFQ